MFSLFSFFLNRGVRRIRYIQIGSTTLMFLGTKFFDLFEKKKLCFRGGRCLQLGRYLRFHRIAQRVAVSMLLFPRYGTGAESEVEAGVLKWALEE